MTISSSAPLDVAKTYGMVQKNKGAVSFVFVLFNYVFFLLKVLQYIVMYLYYIGTHVSCIRSLLIHSIIHQVMF